jgi:alkyl-hydroperoxide reductase/thiol specific antioxidant family protein
LRAHEHEIKARGARLAAIGLGGMEYARQFRQETGIAFPLLVDETSAVHRAAGLKKANLFHLLRGDNLAARKRAKAGGHRQHKLGQDPFQLGGSFVFGPGNRDDFVQISQTFGDNAPLEQVIAAIPAR